jgi:DNA-binding SARP family transcriptional activator
VDFRILGPLEVTDDGRPLPVHGAHQRELLTLLLLDAGRAVSMDRLMDAMWGERQPTAGGTALRVHVSRLRKALDKTELLVTRPLGYALLVPRDNLDLWRFERLLDEGERALASDPRRALDALTRAMAEFRGPPLADVAYAAFAQAAIVRLEELRATALELRIEAELALGRHAHLIGELQSLVAANPLRERLHAQLMTALYRDGRQADALAAYRTARDRLVEEIGIEPGPALRALEARILSQDPSLDGAATPTARPERAALAVCAGDGAPAAVAERLATRAGVEAVAVGLTRDSGALEAATGELRATAPSARVAAFTSDDLGGEAVRLAAEQDAAVLLVSAPADGQIGEDVAAVLQGAACDVALVAGVVGSGPVMVPFGGHEHDWAAAELGAAIGGGEVTLLGIATRGEQRDASRLLASASLALQRGAGVRADTRLAGPGAQGVIEAAAGAGAIVTGLSERWQREGIGAARTTLLRAAPCAVLLVRRGVRPGALAPPEALTRFSWSAAG